MTWMRRLACLVLAGLGSVAAPTVAVAQVPTAAFPYTPIAKGPATTANGPLLVGDRVLVGATRRGRAVVRVLELDGSERQVLEVPNARRTIGRMAASEQAVAVTTNSVVTFSSARGVPAAFGPLAGPLRPFPTRPTDIGVAGSLVVAFDEDVPDRLLVWDVQAPGAPPREIGIPNAFLFAGAAGHYAAVLVGRRSRLHVVVIDLRSGSEVYRVSAYGLQEEAIGSDGRVVMLERASGGTRIVTATPADPLRREITRMSLYAQRLAVSESWVAVVRKAPGGLAQIVLLDYGGFRRFVTPALNGIHELDYDAGRLAFTAGSCVFAGPLPPLMPGTGPRHPCFVDAARLDFGRLDRNAQRGGRRLRVPLRCVVPPRSHCTAHLRLAGPGFVVRRRLRVPPGRHVVRLRIPAAHRDAAWRKGMTIETLDRGRPSSGTVIRASAPGRAGGRTR